MNKTDPFLLTLLVMAAAVTVPFSYVAAQETDTPKAAEEESLPPVLKAGTGECQNLYEAIRKTHDVLPKNMGGVSPTEADRLTAEVRELAGSARRYEEQCTSSDAVQLAEVQYMRAKALYLLSGRFRVETLQKMQKDGVPDLSESLRAAMDAYYSEIQGLAQPAFEALPPDHPFRREALRYYSQASADSRDKESALKAYRLYIELYPDASDIDRVLLAIGRLHLDMGNYDIGIDVAERVQKEYYQRESYATAGELLWKLYHSAGDLDGMLRHVKTVETVYPLKLTNKDLPPLLRERLGLFLDFNGFRKGYTLFARGECVSAIDAFKKHLEYMGSKTGANPAAKVYTQRSTDVLAFVENLGCKPAPKDLDLEWATVQRTSLLESRGKVVALVFRGLRDKRSADFLTPVWEFAKGNSKVEMVTISYLRTGERLETQLQAMQHEMDKLGYTGPAGFDPDAENTTLFRAFQVKVGSATLVVVDPQGKCAWFMEDPRGIDAEFARILLGRLLESKSSQPPAPVPEGSATKDPPEGAKPEKPKEVEKPAELEKTAEPKEPAETSKPGDSAEAPSDSSFQKYVPALIGAGAVLALVATVLLRSRKKKA